MGTPAFHPQLGTGLPHDVDPFKIRRQGGVAPPRTKIICTLGPKSHDPKVLTELLEAGMNVARLNFSHGSYEYHADSIKMIRSVMHQSKRLCAIMLDTKGPEIRTGKLANGDEVRLSKGQEYTFTTDYTFLGDDKTGAISYANITKVIKRGDRVLVEDGNIEFVVEEVGDTWVRTRLTIDCVLGQQKNVNLPGVPIDLPPVTQKDIDDLKFGVEQGIDFVAASFMRNGNSVRALREILGSQGKNIRIISKIESQEGLDNFDEILAESDGIMVARGDLGVNIPIEQVALAQKMMIRKCNLAGKTVVTATQMLDSMITNPNPTRAEATDVANAVFDGSDCVMLSGETAKGAYPIKAVQMMAEICRETEANIDYISTFQSIREMNQLADVSIAEAIASSAVKTAIDLKAALLIVLTETGSTARFVAKYRPAAPILCITASEQVARQTLASRGLLPLLVGSMRGADSLIARAIEVAKKLGMCKVKDVVVATTGAKEGVQGLTNNLKVLTVDY
eukprot:TRINITY_DN2602_c0_g1_i1.p1 TRINITY_DN2602_c0_g1~~TRINITY_DN2602_c0_g1_i1.p1  ORF type:complete len:550 (-),score=161.80 TRINITY_DN2602_c0_g1_i1:41-1564(-)